MSDHRPEAVRLRTFSTPSQQAESDFPGAKGTIEAKAGLVTVSTKGKFDDLAKPKGKFDDLANSQGLAGREKPSIMPFRRADKVLDTVAMNDPPPEPVGSMQITLPSSCPTPCALAAGASDRTGTPTREGVSP